MCYVRSSSKAETDVRVARYPELLTSRLVCVAASIYPLRAPSFRASPSCRRASSDHAPQTLTLQLVLAVWDSNFYSNTVPFRDTGALFLL